MLCSFWLAVAARAQQPNLVFILTDDQGVEAIEGPHWPNDLGVVSPNLSHWAGQGVSFINVRHNPNCSPTRAAIMTGRDCLRTGLYGVIGREGLTDQGFIGGLAEYPVEETFPDAIHLLSLQTYEYTLAEMLQDAGYYTILVNKWHCGYDEGRGELPTQQGFDVWYDWLCNIYCGHADCANQEIPCDEWDETGDENIVEAKTWAATQVNGRPENMPYALFFHTIVPHRREPEAPENLHWWRVHPDLMPQSYWREIQSGGPDELDRYIMNIEAMDTVLGQLLDEIDVVDSSTEGDYLEESDTVVFFTSDNGTDPLLTHLGSTRGKNTLYEGGIHVPLFVFGEGVPSADPELYDDRLISPVDYFATIADIVQPPAITPDPNSRWPRESMSFADAINWADPGDCPERTYSLASLGNVIDIDDPDDCGNDPDDYTTAGGVYQAWEVALVHEYNGALYKLICRSGGPGYAPVVPADCEDCMVDFTCVKEEFYNLAEDSDEEDNLIAPGTSALGIDDWHAYMHMRDYVTDQWASAVSVPLDAANMPNYYVSYSMGSDPVYTLTVEFAGGELQDECNDSFFVDGNGVVHDCGDFANGDYETAYLSLRGDAESDYDNGTGLTAGDVQVIDIPATQIRSVRSDTATVVIPSGSLPQGYDRLTSTWREWRTLVRFGTITLPSGYDADDIIDAQIILRFKYDSQAADETDTGPTRIRRINADVDWWTAPLPNWSTLLNAYDDFTTVQLGMLDLPPHIIAEPVATSGESKRVRVLPLPQDTPVSFGHDVDTDGAGSSDQALVDTVLDWIDSSSTNKGVVLITDFIDPNSWDIETFDQHIYISRTPMWCCV